MREEKEYLTRSESYVKKTNRVILMVGLISLFVFIFGLLLVLRDEEEEEQYTAPVFTANDDALGIQNEAPVQEALEFDNMDQGEIPITTTPYPVELGQVVLGTEAKNVLTIGTTGKVSIRIVSVQLAEPPFDGFDFEEKCNDKVLRGHETCDITMNWIPVVPGNVQNNFIVTWRESNLSTGSNK